MSNQSDNKFQVQPWRLWLVYGVIAFAVITIVVRLVSLQIFSGQEWLDQAVENYVAEVSVPAQRGIIYDRNGYILARNIASYNVIITPAGLPDDEGDIQRIYREISELTGVPAGGPVTDESLENAKLFSACVPGPSIPYMVALGDSIAPFVPVKISCNIGEELARIVRERSVDWPGVSLEIEPVRDYPTGSLTANVMWQKALVVLVLIFILSTWGSPFLALALGLAVALTMGNPFPKLEGKPTTYLLQASVVLLGFGMNLGAVLKAGRSGILFILAVVFGALALGFVFGKLLGTSKRITTLITVGTAICGGSAIAAVGPAIKPENDEMSVSLGTIFVLNVVALFAFPFIGHSLSMSQEQFGLWAAIAIQDTSSVVGASSAYGPAALAIAATVKLARALWIAPFALALAFMFREKDAKAKITVPWFVFLFVGAAAVRTFAPSTSGDNRQQCQPHSGDVAPV